MIVADVYCIRWRSA